MKAKQIAKDGWIIKESKTNCLKFMQLRGLFFQIFHFVKKFTEEPPLKLIKLHLFGSLLNSSFKLKFDLS